MTTGEKLKRIAKFLKQKSNDEGVIEWSWVVENIFSATYYVDEEGPLDYFRIDFWDGEGYFDMVGVNLDQRDNKNFSSIAVVVIDTIYHHLPEEAKETDKERIARLEKEVEELKKRPSITINPTPLLPYTPPPTPFPWSPLSPYYIGDPPGWLQTPIVTFC